MLARRVSVDIQKNGIFLVGKDKTGGHEKMGHGISGKNYSISQWSHSRWLCNSIHRGYEKIANENQPQMMYAEWVFHIIIKLFYKNFKRIAKPMIPIISINIIGSLYEY